MKLHWTFNANVNYQFTLIISEIMKTPLIFVINQSRWEKLPMPEAVSAETETDEDFNRPWKGIADKDRTLAAEWELVTNWKSTTDHCTWYGVTCDHLTDRVIGLAFLKIVTSSPSHFWNFSSQIVRAPNFVHSSQWVFLCTSIRELQIFGICGTVGITSLARCIIDSAEFGQK